MTVKIYHLNDDDNWEEVGVVEDGEFSGDPEFADVFDDLDLTFEDRLVEQFNNHYLNAKKVED